MSDQATRANASATELERLDHWIEGASAQPATGDYIETVSPMTGAAHLRVAAGDAGDVARAVAAAEAARDGWRRFPAAERGRLMLALAQKMRAEKERLAQMERADTGKPMAGALGEIEGSAQYFEFYGSLVYLPVGDVLDVAPDQHVFTRREPYGVIGVITPWNLPLNQAARAIAPALVAGNTIVAKPSEITSRTTIEMARMASEVGFPAGVINIVLGTGEAVGEAIVRAEAVRKVAFTGSVGVGRAIGRIAAERIIPLTLELGGKSANIVFEDADLDLAAAEAVKGFTLNAGQVCSAGTRLLVQRSIYDRFMDKLAAEIAKIVPGENLGPLITPAQFERVKGYFTTAEEDGARLLAGGGIAEVAGQEGGFYVKPTIYADVTNSMRIAREEIFGPVGVAIAFEDEDEAVRIANDSDYGLIGTLWSRDVSRALRVADRIEAGQIFVNVWNTMSVQTPFGGHKNSGYGREKGIEAIHHYSHLKTVTVKI
ncbi:aldehyde dehydrogenase family protein [Limimaricola variabilis]|uniref:aldehyde dehydrogenase family protein n=1 Tax=Limimaricola variabilis TaxID=1492771 RepID=UPI002AC8DED0|nr:aldehyde dehydrogenase family protein [Limimaricola variabilis]WPY95046.1 aldehyde dehydrogenase family protein [Limimaricola variabilis]